jgi:hypothetical protein
MLTMATLHTSALFRGLTAEPTSALNFSLKASSQCSKLIHYLAPAAQLLTCSREISGSNLSRDTDCDDRGFSCTCLASSGKRLTASQNWRRPLHSASFPTQYLSDYPTIDATQPEIQTSLNKPQINLFGNYRTGVRSLVGSPAAITSTTNVVTLSCLPGAGDNFPSGKAVGT